MSLHITYTTTLTDYQHTDRAAINYFTSGDVNQTRQFSSALYTFLGLGLFVLVLSIISGILHIGFSITGFVLGILFYVFATRYKVRRLQRQVTPKADCSLFGQHEILLEDLSYTIKGPATSCSVQWQSVTAIQEDPDYFYIFTDALRSDYIPKRDMASQALQDSLRRFLNDKLTEYQQNIPAMP